MRRDEMRAGGRVVEEDEEEWGEAGEKRRRKRRRDKRLIFGLLRPEESPAGRVTPAIVANLQTKKPNPSLHPSILPLFSAVSLPSLPLRVARGFSNPASRTASLPSPAPLPSLTHLFVPSPLPSFLSFPSLCYPLVSAPSLPVSLSPSLPLSSLFLEEEIGSCPCP